MIDGVLGVKEAVDLVEKIVSDKRGVSDANFWKRCPQDYIEGKEWKRLGGTAGEKLFANGDITQGTFPDCFWCAVVGALTRKAPRYIEDMFLTKTVNVCGVYAVQFYRDGKRFAVVVDDNIPLTDKGKPVFVRSTTEASWPAILEKAYAKFYGGFQDIMGGNIAEAFYDMTGLPVLPSFREVKHALSIVGTSSKHSKKTTGITGNHAFAVTNVHNIQTPKGVQTIVELWDPQGKPSSWKGQWCEGSKSWTKKVKAVVSPKPPTTGTFYLSRKEFDGLFESYHTCLPMDLAKATHANYTTELKAGKAGGSPQYATFKENPLYAIRGSGEVFITVRQDEQRGIVSGPIEYKLLGTTVLGVPDGEEPNPSHLVTGNMNVLTNATFCNKRDIVANTVAVSNAWRLVVPSAHAPDVHVPFSVSMVSTKPFECKEINWEKEYHECSATGTLNKQTLNTAPQYVVNCDEDATLHVIIKQKSEKGVKGVCYMAAAAFRNSKGVHVKSAGKSRITPEKLKFSNYAELSLTLSLKKKDFPCTVIPVAHEPAVCSFSFSVLSKSPTMHLDTVSPPPSPKPAKRDSVTRPAKPSAKPSRVARAPAKPAPKSSLPAIPPGIMKTSRQQCAVLSDMYGGL